MTDANYAMMTTQTNRRKRYSRAKNERTRNMAKHRVHTSRSKKTTCFNCKKPCYYARDCRLKSGNKSNQRNDKCKRNLDAFLISLNNLTSTSRILGCWTADARTMYADRETGSKISVN